MPAETLSAGASFIALNSCSQKENKKVCLWVFMKWEDKSSCLNVVTKTPRVPRTHQSRVILTSDWFCCGRRNVNTCRVHLYVDLQLWFRTVSSEDIPPSGQTGIQHQLRQCFKATLNDGDIRSVVRQHFTDISEPYLPYRVPLDEVLKIQTGFRSGVSAERE